MNKPIYAVIETDVDGCGTDATEYVEFDHDGPLPDNVIERFRDFLRDAKEIANGSSQPFDTAEIITDALDMLRNATGISGQTVFAPVTDEIRF